MENTYTGSGMNVSFSETREERTILFLLEAICGLFEAHFDSGWFLNILDRMSFSPSVMRDIRVMIHLASIDEGDIPKLEAGADGLKEFLEFAHRSVLPVLRDQLGISGFSTLAAGPADATTNVLKGFFFYTFPHNLRRLSDLYSQLEPLVEGLRGPAVTIPGEPSARAAGS